MRFDRLPTWDDQKNLHVVVESPRGSNVKLAWDEKLRVFTISRSLVLGASYPYDWGFVPSTIAEDGDPLDAMAIFDGSTFPGVVLKCRPIGVVRVEEHGDDPAKKRRNDRVICVASDVARLAHVKNVSDLDARTRDELAAFFGVTVLLEKQIRVLGWGTRGEAEQEIGRAAARYEKKQKKKREKRAAAAGSPK